jgi:hypothetical protein
VPRIGGNRHQAETKLIHISSVEPTWKGRPQIYRTFSDPNRWCWMEMFRLLFFRGNLLERAEEVQAANVLEAIQGAFGRPPEIRVEVWSDKGCIGVVGNPRH